MTRDQLESASGHRFGALAHVLIALGASAAATGCATLSSLTSDPMSAKYIQEPAPLGVVIQRRDAAATTATEVDRLLAGTPMDMKSAWPDELKWSKNQISSSAKAADNHPYYRGKEGVKVLDAIIWADLLSQVAAENEVDTKSKTGDASPIAVDRQGDDVAENEPKEESSDAVATAEEITVDVTKDAAATEMESDFSAHDTVVAAEDAAKSADGATEAVALEGTTSSVNQAAGEITTEEDLVSSGDEASARGMETTNEAAAAPMLSDSKLVVEDDGGDVTPPNDETKTKPSRDPSPILQRSLLAMLSHQFSDAYMAIEAKEDELDHLHADVESKEQAQDADGISDADEAKLEKQVEVLENQIEAKQAELEAARESLVNASPTMATKIPQTARDRFGAVLVNLHEAVEAAQEANAAAAVRYPVVVGSKVTQGLHALSALKDDIVAAAKANASDYIYEKTGERPDVSQLQVELAFENRDVDLKLAGIPANVLSKIDVAQLLDQTTARTQAFAEKTLSFLWDAESTKERLDFQEQLLAGIIEGFESSGWDAPDAVAIRGGFSLGFHL